MDDNRLTKRQLLRELTCMRRCVARLESAQANPGEARPAAGENDQFLELILDHTHVLAAYLDPAFNFVWVNRAYAAVAGRDPSYFLGKNHFELYPHAENEAIFRNVVATGEPFLIAAKPFEHPDQPQRGTTHWDWSLVPVKDDSGSVTHLVFTLADVTERVRAEEALRRSTDLLDSVRDAQALFIGDSAPEEVFESLLNTLVRMTDSEFGFLDEVRRDEDGSPYKVSLALSNIAWDEASRKLYAELRAHSLEFRDLSNLAGAPAVTGKLVIANDAPHDPRSGGVPTGHPPIHAFMGIPLYFGGELVGVAGVANRPEGYDEQIARFLQPFTSTCASIIHAFRSRQSEEHANEALRRSEERFRQLAESAHDLITVADETGRTLWANAAWRGIFGEDLNRWRDPFERIHPEDRQAAAEAWSGLISKGESIASIEYRYLGPNDKCLVLETSAYPVAFGEQVQYCVLAHDITARRQAADAIRDSEGQLSAIFENTPSLLALVDSEFRVRRINRTLGESGHSEARTEAGLMCGEALRCLHSLDVPEGCGHGPSCDQCVVRRVVRDTLETGQAHREVEASFSVREDGENAECEVLLSSAPVRAGGEDMVLVAMEDITDRKRAEEELREQTRLARTLLDSMPCVAMLLRPSTREIVLANRAALEASCVMGRTCYGSWPKFDAPCPWCLAPDVWKDGKAQHVEVEGIGIVWDANWVPIGDDLYLHYAFDITARRQAQQRLLAYQRQLSAMAAEMGMVQERERNQLASDLHDHVIQDLAVSRMRLQSLRKGLPDGERSEELSEVIGLIEESVQDLRSLTFQLSPASLLGLGLGAALDSLVDNVQKTHGLTCRIEHDANDMPLSDDVRLLLYRCTRELLLNAVKHAMATRAVVRVRREADEIEIRVEDDGQGFEPRDPQVPVDGGAGFGLFSIRVQIEHAGGRLEVDSAPGEGTRATLRVPLQR